MRQGASVLSSWRCPLPEIGRSRQEQHLLQKLSNLKKQVNQTEKIIEMRKCEKDMDIRREETHLEMLRDEATGLETAKKRRELQHKGSYLVKELVKQKKAKKPSEKVDEVSEGARHFLEIGKSSAVILEKYHKLRMRAENDKKQLRPHILGAKHLNKILRSKEPKEEKKPLRLRGKSKKAAAPIRPKRVKKANVTFDAVENAAKALEESNRQRRAEEATAEENDEEMKEENEKNEKKNEEQRQSDGCIRTPFITRSGRTVMLPEKKTRAKREHKAAPAPKQRKDTIHGRKVESVKITQANMVPGKVKEVARQLKNSVTTKLPSTREMLAQELAISDSEDEDSKVQLEAITNSILGVKAKGRPRNQERPP
ncbi:unnamed protein product, partial [Mesorhabditis belari]|uniref:Uncharacterized protein n=1 Tax=Mesorhabditis belari TaxID=2138241 RepID=A0AAF3ENL2_9BILA